MKDSDCEQDVPHRVLDMLRMFLAASTRGEQAVLILETKNKQLITKYRSVEKKVAGASATAKTPASNNDRRKVTQEEQGGPGSGWSSSIERKRMKSSRGNKKLE